MGSRTLIQFPIFSPPAPPLNHRPATEVRFSRWNNANAEKFIRHERTQKELEDEIRFRKRFDSALNIANNYNHAPPSPVSEKGTFYKSTGTPSSPSSPSIPGKKSKYSKPLRNNKNRSQNRPAFEPSVRSRKLPEGTFDSDCDIDDDSDETERIPKYSRSFRNENPDNQNHPAFKTLVRSRKIPVQSHIDSNFDEGGENSVVDKKSKYSRTFLNKNTSQNHPAFKPLVRPRKIPKDSDETLEKSGVDIKVNDDGVCYGFPEAPFLYQYSYTETPKVKPNKLREPLVSPFGPETMARPWTGRKPLPPSKKNLPEFDSFVLPPSHKKGVKPVQAPGPFLKGSGPKYVMSREEVLGEPLTKEETMELINSCKKTPRQMNMGRDGLTHNMLDNIHAHWKRKRVCKIKCKGVCTVDMDNVCDKLEEKTGGKIIYHQGGLIYLFRGRNYNYKTRPRFPLMLWRPVTPVYPRLVKRVPEGLTLEEANEMRKKGRDLIPICKLAKNGVYCDLAKNVREAFEACELVRINCQGLNSSDYRRIGAKLKDLVPCVLISFELQHILMWRGRDWVSSLPEDGDLPKRVNGSEADNAASNYPSGNPSLPSMEMSPQNLGATSTSLGEEDAESNSSIDDESDDCYPESSDEVPSDFHSVTTPEMGTASDDACKSDSSSLVPLTGHEVHSVSEDTNRNCESVSSTLPWMERILPLWNHAIESGSAVLLDDSSFDADIVYKTAVTLSESAPPGPVFQHRPKKVPVQKREVKETLDLKTESTKETSLSSLIKEAAASDRKIYTRKSSTKKLKGIREDYLNVVPKGSLGVDELAKLLA